LTLESTQTHRRRLLGRVEIDLGPVDEAEPQYKSWRSLRRKAACHYDDAVEFVRVVKGRLRGRRSRSPLTANLGFMGYREINTRHANTLLQTAAPH